MNIGQAIEEMINDRRVSRAGWNGKGMYLYLRTENGFEPCFVLRTTMGTDQPGWNASTPDLLAQDWGVVEP
jgi:hypothetical protein